MKDLSFLKEAKIAHRGIFDNQRIYENTIASFKRAIKYNYIIELDIRMLADGTIICFHDDNTARLLHVDNEVDKLTYEELQYISNFVIPTFESVLELIKGKNPLLIELKTKSRHYIFEKKVAEILDKYEGLYAIQSYNKKSAKWFLKNRQDIPVGYLICRKNFKKDLLLRKFDFLCVNILIFDDKKIRKMREEKLIIGYKILTMKEYNEVKDVYDNLVCDNLVEIDNL